LSCVRCKWNVAILTYDIVIKCLFKSHNQHFSTASYLPGLGNLSSQLKSLRMWLTFSFKIQVKQTSWLAACLRWKKRGVFYYPPLPNV